MELRNRGASENVWRTILVERLWWRRFSSVPTQTHVMKEGSTLVFMTPDVLKGRTIQTLYSYTLHIIRTAPPIGQA